MNRCNSMWLKRAGWRLACFSLAITTAHAQEWRSITPDVIYGHKSGMALTYDVIRPTEGANGAAVLFMVSGGWVSSYSPPELIVREKSTDQNLFEKIVRNGYTLVLVRHGSSPQFKVPEVVADVRQAVRHVRAHASEFGFSPDKIGVCGGSAGGHLSLVLGTMGDDGNPKGKDMESRTSDRVQAVVAYFPPTDIRTYVNHPELSKQFPALVFDEGLADDISPLLAVSPDDAPALLIHGDKDDLVPLWHSEKIEVAFKEHKVDSRLMVMTGAAHGFNTKQNKEAETALLDWFDKYLQPKSNGEKK